MKQLCKYVQEYLCEKLRPTYLQIMKQFVNNEISFLSDVCFNVITTTFQSNGVHTQKLRIYKVKIYSIMFSTSCDEYITTSQLSKLIKWFKISKYEHLKSGT